LDISDQRIPVTILTGFLGAGKTTILNSILSEENSERIVVIVNEFGDIGLDHDLIESVKDEIVLMASGCLCCSLRGDLSEMIDNLLGKRSERTLDFERIVIETTGIADPGPILQTMLIDPRLAREVRMDGVITVVDGVNGSTTLDANFEAVSQIAMADLILLSKTDIANKEEVAKFENRIHSLNNIAKIIQVRSGNIRSQVLWNLSALQKGVEPSAAIAWTTTQFSPNLEPDPLSNLSGLSGTKTEFFVESLLDHGVNSASIVLESPIKSDVFDRWLDTLIILRGPDILRVKGIVFIEEIELPFVFHGVQHIFDPPVPINSWTGNDRKSRIVVIARNLKNSELQRSFDMLR
jgi:G3E family GTPase